VSTTDVLSNLHIGWLPLGKLLLLKNNNQSAIPTTSLLFKWPVCYSNNQSAIQMTSLLFKQPVCYLNDQSVIQTTHLILYCIFQCNWVF